MHMMIEEKQRIFSILRLSYALNTFYPFHIFYNYTYVLPTKQSVKGTSGELIDKKSTICSLFE